MFETLFQLYGLDVVVRFSVSMQGPFSSNSPMSESDPGPPLSQSVNGSFDGLLRDSKNQKKTWTYEKSDQSQIADNDRITHIWCEVHISRVAVYAGSCFADAGILVPNCDIVRCCRGLVIIDLFWEVQIIAALAPMLFGNSISLQHKRRKRQQRRG
jgi:hypothetical protein